MGLKDASAKYPEKTEPLRRKLAPRRTPPAESKSLPAHKKQELARQGIETSQAQDPSKQKSTQLPQQDTHDSNGSDESASKWFDKANERGPQGQRESPSTDGTYHSSGSGCVRILFTNVLVQSHPSSLATRSSTSPTTLSHLVATMTRLAPSIAMTARTRTFAALSTTSPSRIRG